MSENTGSSKTIQSLDELTPEQRNLFFHTWEIALSAVHDALGTTKSYGAQNTQEALNFIDELNALSVTF